MEQNGDELMNVIYDIDKEYEIFISKKLKEVAYLSGQKFMDDITKWQHEWLNMNGVTDEMIIAQL